MERVNAKRVLCVLSTMNMGGAETFLMKIYRSLDKNSFQMDFCVDVTEKCFYEDEIASMGGRFFHIPSRSDSYKRHKTELSRIIKEQSYINVLFVSSSPLCFLDCKTAKKSGANHVLVRSTNAPSRVSISNRMLMNFLRCFCLKYVDVMISPSDLAAQYLFGKKNLLKVNILKNGIDLGFFSFNQDYRREIRKSLGIPLSSYVIGHVGRFNPQKNHAFIISVFKKFFSLHPDAFLLLIGEGNLKASIVRLAESENLSNNVVFIDATPEVNRFYSAMDIFILPSFYEGMPNVAIEAQANGLRCLLSKTITNEADITGENEYLGIDSVDEWVKSLEEGILYKRQNYSALLKLQGYDIQSVAQVFESLLK